MNECLCHLCCYARKHPQLGPAPHATAPTIERERFMRVVSMDETRARAFSMPHAVKALYVGRADPTRYRFGAKHFLLFETWDDYHAYLRELAPPITAANDLDSRVHCARCGEHVRDPGAAQVLCTTCASTGASP